MHDIRLYEGISEDYIHFERIFIPRALIVVSWGSIVAVWKVFAGRRYQHRMCSSIPKVCQIADSPGRVAADALVSKHRAALSDHWLDSPERLWIDKKRKGR